MCFVHFKRHLLNFVETHCAFRASSPSRSKGCILELSVPLTNGREEKCPSINFVLNGIFKDSQEMERRSIKIISSLQIQNLTQEHKLLKSWRFGSLVPPWEFAFLTYGVLHYLILHFPSLHLVLSWCEHNLPISFSLFSWYLHLYLSLHPILSNCTQYLCLLYLSISPKVDIFPNHSIFSMFLFFPTLHFFNLSFSSSSQFPRTSSFLTLP